MFKGVERPTGVEISVHEAVTRNQCAVYCVSNFCCRQDGTNSRRRRWVNSDSLTLPRCSGRPVCLRWECVAETQSNSSSHPPLQTHTHTHTHTHRPLCPRPSTVVTCKQVTIQRQSLVRESRRVVNSIRSRHLANVNKLVVVVLYSPNNRQ